MTYSNSNDWGSGFTANVTITNPGSTAINGWTLTWSFPGNQSITGLWNGSYTQNGQSVSVTNLGYNNIISAGGNTSFGFNANYSGTNANPTNFAVNGIACGGVGWTSHKYTHCHFYAHTLIYSHGLLYSYGFCHADQWL